MPPSPPNRSIGLDSSSGSPAQQAAGEKYLLAIGIDAYDENNHFQRLTYPTTDVGNLVAILQQEYGFDPKNTFTLCNAEGTVKGIKSKIIDIRKKLKDEDTLMVFFAGHGAASQNNGYWITFDSEQEIELNLSVSEIIALLAACTCSQVLLVIDCCFSGQATEKAYSRGVFTDINLFKSRFAVITSGNKHQVVPDKSLFMEVLLEILRTKHVLNFEGLVGDLKASLGERNAGSNLTDYKNAYQGTLPFIFQRKDLVSFDLTNAFFELNYKAQLDMEYSGHELFNLVYLRGTRECGHHIFTHRFFKEVGKSDVNMHSHLPYIMSFGTEARSADYSIWRYLAGVFSVSQSDTNQIISKILGEIESKDWLLIVKVDRNCDIDELETALVDFWQVVNDYLTQHGVKTQGYSNGVYVFIWDRRGDADEDAGPEKLRECPVAESAKLIYLPPIEPLRPGKDLVKWHGYAKTRYERLKKEEDFLKIDIHSIKTPHTIENVICQIARSCNRPGVYENLFIKKNLWLP